MPLAFTLSCSYLLLLTTFFVHSYLKPDVDMAFKIGFLKLLNFHMVLNNRDDSAIGPNSVQVYSEIELPGWS